MPQSHQELLERYRRMDTKELIHLLTQKQDDETLRAIQQVLERRHQRFPDDTKPLAPAPKRTNTRCLGVDSNASVSDLILRSWKSSSPATGFFGAKNRNSPATKSLCGTSPSRCHSALRRPRCG